MKKRILGILTVALALSMAFTMVSCGDGGGGGGGGGNNVTITFKSGYGTNATLGTATIPKDTAIPADKFPTNIPAREADADGTEYYFEKWVLDSDKTKEILSADKPNAYKFGGNATVVIQWGSYNPATEALIKFYWTNTVDKPTTLQALYSILVTPDETIKIDKGEAVDPFPANPSKSGYTFMSWNGAPEADFLDLEDIEGLDDIDFEAITSTTTFSENYVVSAQWEAVVGGGEMVTITYDLNWPAEDSGTPPTIADKQVEVGVQISAAAIPTPSPVPDGYVFGGWWDDDEGTGTRYTATSVISEDTTFFAKWIKDVLTPDDEAFELLYLENGAAAIYKFDLGTNNLTEYQSLTVQYKVSAAVLNNWSARVGNNGAIRLIGIYTPEFIATETEDASNDPSFKILNRYSDSNKRYNPFIMDQSNTQSSVVGSITANEWFTITYDLSGNGKHPTAAEVDKVTPTTAHTGVLYFGLGISGVDSNKGRDRSLQFVQLVGEIKLVPKTNADEIVAQKPTGDEPLFACADDPIAFSWRGDPTAENIANPPYPTYEFEEPYDRGDPPADADLEEVVLGTTGANLYTFINGDNVTNQKGWISFGGSQSKNTSTVPSGVAFENFRNAWYLVLEVENAPTGELSVVWMGDASEWKGQTKFVNNGAAAIEGTSWITTEGAKTVIKMLLTKLDAYREYYEENTAWAGLSLSYWGANSVGPDSMSITKAYLLVDKDEVVGPKSGMNLTLSFSLGTAPAGGALIDDVMLTQSGNLVVKAVGEITGWKWYVDGTQEVQSTPSATLTKAVTDGTYAVSLQALRDGKWVSQTVFVTVNN